MKTIDTLVEDIYNLFEPSIKNNIKEINDEMSCIIPPPTQIIVDDLSIFFFNNLEMILEILS